MERFNFDQIFEGTPEDQLYKASVFLSGLKLTHKHLSERYAEAVLTDREYAPREWGAVVENNAAQEAFIADPRTLALQEIGIKKQREAEAEGIIKKIRTFFES